MEGKQELARERLEGVASGARRNRGDGATAGEELQLADAVASAARFPSHQCDGAADTLRGNATFGDVLEGAEGDEIAEIIEAFTPARPWMDEPKPLPISQARRLDAHDAAHFPLCEAFRQNPRFSSKLRRPAEAAACIDYAPRVNPLPQKFRKMDAEEDSVTGKHGGDCRGVPPHADLLEF